MRTNKRTTQYKIQLFAGLFQGLRSAYGTYSPASGQHWQVKERVNTKTVYNHLKGIQPYGFYPLISQHTRVGVIDFDLHDPEPPLQYIARARHHGIPAYLERSKSKGFHVWMFFSNKGVMAWKARLVMQFILTEIEHADVEIFPKQDGIFSENSFGNFINAPLFGKSVPVGRTVFIRPEGNLAPYRNQWDMLESIQKIPEQHLDAIIDINSLDKNPAKDVKTSTRNKTGYALPACIRRILAEGVRFDQRVACFRIAVHFRRIGLPYDMAVIALSEWSKRNKPVAGKRIITSNEIEEQASWAYRKNYTGYGCQEPVIRMFCDVNCPLHFNR